MRPMPKFPCSRILPPRNFESEPLPRRSLCAEVSLRDGLVIVSTAAVHQRLQQHGSREAPLAAYQRAIALAAVGYSTFYRERNQYSEKFQYAICITTYICHLCDKKKKVTN